MAVGGSLTIFCIAWVGFVATPAHEATRLRNALLAKRIAFDEWERRSSKEPYPEEFDVETLETPEPILEILRSLSTITSTTDGVTVRRLIRHLDAIATTGEALQTTSAEAYKQIIHDGTGYCADYTQVFLSLLLAADIPVREWGMSFDGFSGDGHAFAEYFDRQLGQWVFVDPFHSLLVEARDTGRPLSVVEFFQHLADDETQLEVVPIEPKRFVLAIGSAEKTLAYYRRGIGQVFLWDSNAIYSYEANRTIAMMGRIHRAVEQSVAILLGVHPRIWILETDTNGKLIGDLMKLRNQFFIVAFGGFAGAILFLAGLIFGRAR